MLLADKVVKAPDPAVVLPIEPGAAKVAPPNVDAFRFGTFVVEDTVNGAVPVATVDTSVFAVIEPLTTGELV